MSVVVGIIKNNKVYMAADSLSTSEDGERRLRADKKLFKNGKYIIGYTGSPRTGQILKPYHYKPPNNIYDFPDDIRNHFREKGCLCEVEGLDAMSSNLLIGYNGKLYEILIDYQLVELVEPYSAVGSGKFHALGSLRFAELTGLFDTMSPPDLLETAINVSAFFCSSVGGPIEYEME